MLWMNTGETAQGLHSELSCCAAPAQIPSATSRDHGQHSATWLALQVVTRRLVSRGGTCVIDVAYITPMLAADAEAGSVQVLPVLRT